MVTRRTVLKGAAAGSIAAIASSHGVAAGGAAFPSNACAVGQLEGGALASFHKHTEGLAAFVKWNSSAFDVFYKENAITGVVDIFLKWFDKGWANIPIKALENVSLKDADAGFYKLQSDSAGFFLKIEDGYHFLTLYSNGEVDDSDPRLNDNPN